MHSRNERPATELSIVSLSLTWRLQSFAAQRFRARCHAKGRTCIRAALLVTQAIEGVTHIQARILSPTLHDSHPGTCIDAPNPHTWPPCRYLQGQTPCSGHPCYLKLRAAPQFLGPPRPVEGEMRVVKFYLSSELLLCCTAGNEAAERERAGDSNEAFISLKKYSVHPMFNKAPISWKSSRGRGRANRLWQPLSALYLARCPVLLLC